MLVIILLISMNEHATGAHHVITFYPYVFILVAFAVIELGRWLGKLPVIAGILTGACLLVLFTAQIVVDARHLASFRAEGGNGYWSDAIYDLASFALSHPDKDYLLMDWGFSNQLVLLTHNRIHYEEFVCAPKNLDACMDSILTQRNAFLLFHVRPSDNAQILAVYKQALTRHQLQGRIAKTFYQKDGHPVYVAYESSNPSLLLPATGGKFCSSREAEAFDAKSGGGLDKKDGASNRQALGNFWGVRREDFVSYKFTLSRSVADAHLYLRYAFIGPNPQQYYLFMDGNFLSAITLPATNGYGYTSDEWKTYETGLGNLTGGIHELKIMPAEKDQIVNLDRWSIWEGTTRPDR
jgi:hypothetical protein